MQIKLINRLYKLETKLNQLYSVLTFQRIEPNFIEICLHNIDGIIY